MYELYRLGYIMREPLQLEQFLNQRDIPAYQKYLSPKTGLYNLKQFLIDNGYAVYNKSTKLFHVKSTIFDPAWNMSYLYAQDLDFSDCSVFGCHLVYGDYSRSLFTSDSLYLEGNSSKTNFSFSKCHSSIFSSSINHNKPLSGINFSNCDLSEAIFSGVQVYNTSFIKSYLSSCQFMNCELRDYVIFDFSHIESTIFTSCNIHSASFQHSNLKDTTFIRCCIIGSDGNEIDFRSATLDNILLTPDSTDNCPEISLIDLRDTYITNSQLTNLKLTSVKINSNFIIQNSAIYDTRIRINSDQCIYSCQLQGYFDRQNIRYTNIQFVPPGSICWDNSIDGVSTCKDSSYNTRSLIFGFAGFGAAILIVLLIIAAVKIHRNYIRPCLNHRQILKQIKWKTWPLTKALSDSDIDALNQIRELAGKYSNQIPRDIYKLILNMRAGQSDENYRHTQIEFGDLFPSYQAPEHSVLAVRIRFFDMKDRIHYRREQIDHTLTQFFRHPIQQDKELRQNFDESTPLIEPAIY